MNIIDIAISKHSVNYFLNASVEYDLENVDGDHAFANRLIILLCHAFYLGLPEDFFAEAMGLYWVNTSVVGEHFD